MNNITCERYYKLIHKLPMVESERGDTEPDVFSKLAELYKRLAEANPELERICGFWTYALNALPLKDTYNKADIDYLEKCIEGMLSFVQIDDSVCLERLDVVYTTNGSINIYATLEIGISITEPPKTETNGEQNAS